jgi:hypothetical protein
MTDKTVSHAIERGIDFLFANRLFCGNEPRLWEDFDLLLGPSDEWVTAYAARALLHTNEERSVWAAREALHALLIEQSSTGKVRRTADPSAPQISCRELRLRSTACGSLYGEPHAWSPVRAVR